MADTILTRAKKLQGAIKLPGDKSISHRAALISLLCKDPLELTNFSDGEDCGRTLEAVSTLGVTIERDRSDLKLTPPPDGLKAPDDPINCGNSGTTMRLLTGLLAGSRIEATLYGDESLSGRPMNRIVDPLCEMNGAVAVSEDGCAPIVISPAEIIPIDYSLPVASAQVKSALLLAGLAGNSKVTIREKILTRDHTERMIGWLGGKIAIEDIKTEIIPDPNDPRKKLRVKSTTDYKRSIMLDRNDALSGGRIDIPGDISTASFVIAAGLIVPGSHLIVKDVGINPTRTGFITILKKMGAQIAIKNRREVSGEPIGDIEVSYSKLKPRKISGDMIANLIDELPILAVLAASIEGTTIIRDATELRHKESDRIRAIVDNLQAMGVKVGEFPDGFAVEGNGEIGGGEIDSLGDHRIAMAFSVAALAAHGQTVIKDSDVVAISCPQYFPMLEGLRCQ